MRNDPEAIYYAFAGKLVGTKSMKGLVCDAVALLPDELIEKVTKNCWFISSMEDAWAFTFKGNDLKDQDLIFLSDSLLAQDAHQISYSIIHEIGHVVLNHRNSTTVKQTKEEIRRQELEADNFARLYV
ncbi:MAG TPA: hypothetical protein VHE53_04130 [Patescibacteria group bacterium]|nr:hypothetical protein [Patescibacteria group bacterium]